MKDELLVFSDASFDPKSERGVGAILILREEDWSSEIETLDVKTKAIESTNIARLEILTALWALEEVSGLKKSKVTLFTDSQSIEKLPTKRAKLEAADYRSKAGRALANGDLYRRFFTVYDAQPFTIVWVKGHSPASRRSEIQRVFSQVDRAARRGLRANLSDQ